MIYVLRPDDFIGLFRSIGRASSDSIEFVFFGPAKIKQNLKRCPIIIKRLEAFASPEHHFDCGSMLRVV